MPAEVIVTVKRDGTATVHASGVVGPSCATHTGPFVQALGRATGNHPLPEMFQEAEAQNQTRVNQ
jgi:hypothetical protein